jgi:uncharacterized protein YlzI (FlbEa/FlbD family)
MKRDEKIKAIKESLNNILERGDKTFVKESINEIVDAMLDTIYTARRAVKIWAITAVIFWLICIGLIIGH